MSKSIIEIGNPAEIYIDLFSDAGGPLSRRLRAPLPSSLFSAPPLSPCLSRTCYWSWAESVLWRSDSLVRVVALSGYLSGTGAVGRESLWVGVDSFSCLLRSLEVASVFPDLGFGLRVTASGVPVRLLLCGSVVVVWLRGCSIGDGHESGSIARLELSTELGQTRSGGGSLIILFHNKCVELSTWLGLHLSCLLGGFSGGCVLNQSSGSSRVSG
ncbi:hypothetical protein IGI04_014472 [Brassica rapa subsp. trilocularis]|uniref:Uncharacterized protein n=1 Tax=Brassica rapa subsp. trilocularis TaxID=1813537 RepID=A0ABQ7MPS5_BRACM|nr:hypothetical protein IGI04_014472 [Brassica rapa subsp. trilocularis]